MMRKFSWMLLVLLVLVGCGDEFTEDEEKALKDLVKDEVVAGAEMVLIPGGSFEMGNHFGEGDGDELPVHTVELDEFYMDAHEVTVGQFREFVSETDRHYNWWDRVAEHSPHNEYPMIHVDWLLANAYAKWAGKRLPTEAEWEYAARGGLRGKRYPWGDDKNVARDHANYRGTGRIDKWGDRCSPVGSFEANGYGLYDMGGNVWEWCADWYDEDYYSKSPAKNPLEPASGTYRLMRGADLGTTIRTRCA